MVVKRVYVIYDYDIDIDETVSNLKEEVEDVLDDEFKLHIRGQLVYIDEWKKLVFLGCPMISNLKRMIENGLFISDMSTHDLSR